ncbi:MAG: ATP phosphoribosyltransferase regulatory subunit [Clostridia bacterium]|nr:ATP phosphoribosyltransferase regulatory subunit [Clostridia bacterium]
MNNEITYSQELLIPKLRSIYEQRGYKKYKMSKFEEYDLYLENKSFLKSENIITFNDLNGRLLALKPDVTLSIVKNSAATPQKVYYTENVYRVKSGQYKEIMQVGLEYIGKIDMYTLCEVISLAADSLSAVCENYILDISHMGFISGFLDELKLPASACDEMLELISRKDAHEIKGLCEKYGVDRELTEKTVSMATLYGSMDKMLPACEALSVNQKTKDAAAELRALYTALAAIGCEKNINLDFSITSDLSYYNGIIFQGFINGVSGSVLSGGRYGNLLSKMGKHTDAIGFAVYLDMLEYLESGDGDYDVDVMLLYGESSDTVALTKAVKMLNGNGNTVLASTEIPQRLRYKQLLQFNERGLEIIEGND